VLAHHPRRLLAFALLVLVSVAAAVVATRSPGAENPRSELIDKKLGHLSQSVGLHVWIANPDAAPPAIRQRFEDLHAFATSNRARSFRRRAHAAQAPGGLPVFNRDVSGLPQNEESVSACRSNPDFVLEDTNDYRFLLDPDENSTGWDFSNDGGHTVTNEGLLPTVVVNGKSTPSGGDPIAFFDGTCHVYAGDLNFDPVEIGRASCRERV